MKELFAMGGYALYVWPAYAITLLVFALNLIFSLQEKTSVKKQVRRQLKNYE